MFKCVDCDGYGCSQCNDGFFLVESCARKMVPIEVWAMLKWVLRYTENSMKPEDGNGLSQTQSFLDCLDFYTSEINSWKNKLNIK
jgi:hypothetical protein